MRISHPIAENRSPTYLVMHSVLTPRAPCRILTEWRTDRTGTFLAITVKFRCPRVSPFPLSRALPRRESRSTFEITAPGRPLARPACPGARLPNPSTKRRASCNQWSRRRRLTGVGSRFASRFVRIRHVGNDTQRPVSIARLAYRKSLPDRYRCWSSRDQRFQWGKLCARNSRRGGP
jgi:hypothetical protein